MSRAINFHMFNSETLLALLVYGSPFCVRHNTEVTDRMTARVRHVLLCVLACDMIIVFTFYSNILSV